MPQNRTLLRSVEGFYDRDMPRFAVILPAAGESRRFRNQPRKKPFVELAGRPVWLRAAAPFLSHPDVVQVVVVINPTEWDWFHQEYASDIEKLRITVVAGGAERADSVGNALSHLHPEVDFIAVHDAARPVLHREWVDRVFAVAVECGAALLATPITSTVKRSDADGVIVETVPRTNLWAAQTPQVFRRSILEEGYRRRGMLQPTDEAQLVESIGQSVRLVASSPLNIKLTTEEDLAFAAVALHAAGIDATGN